MDRNAISSINVGCRGHRGKAKKLTYDILRFPMETHGSSFLETKLPIYPKRISQNTLK